MNKAYSRRILSRRDFLKLLAVASVTATGHMLFPNMLLGSIMTNRSNRPGDLLQWIQACQQKC
jgi:hypothetical protein